MAKLRTECLNWEYFLNVMEAKVILEIWRRDFNECRPHSWLGYLTPIVVSKPKQHRRRVIQINLVFTSRSGEKCGELQRLT